MADGPGQTAARYLQRIQDAHRRIRRAWDQQVPLPHQAGMPETGRVDGGDRPDPTYRTHAAADHVRQQLRRQIADATVDVLGTLDRALGRDTSHMPAYLRSRTRRVVDLLALHRQWSGQLAAVIRRLQDDPTRWDDAHELLLHLSAATTTIAAIATEAHRLLLEPDADPGTRVCGDDRCQRALGRDETDLCRICAGREERRARLEEQRRYEEQQAAALLAEQRAAGLVCHGRIRDDCTRPLTDEDRRRRRDCGPCRTHKSSTRPDSVGTGGTFNWNDPT